MKYKSKERKGMRLFCEIIMFVFLLACAGCVSPRVTYIPIEEEPRVSEEYIQILKEKPERPFRTIGLLDVSGTDWSSKEEMLKALKRKAYLVGADAIIDLEYERGGEKLEPATKGQYVSGGLLWDLPERKVDKLFGSINLRAKAIKYVDESKSDPEGGEE